MRKYSSIWNALKKDKKCAIAAPIPLHPRIIKAVIAEKYRDSGHRLLTSLSRKRTKLVHIVTGSRIEFLLKEYDVLSGISSQELGD